MYSQFYSFVDMADGGAASKASCILKNLVDEVEGLIPDHMAHGLRAGAADGMLLNKLCTEKVHTDLSSIPTRGGHLCTIKN
jgi:hypothetical protein